MDAAPIIGPTTPPTVEARIPTAVAALAITALGIVLGIHAGLTVAGARESDGSMFRLLPWLVYPGVVGIIAVRTRSEMLVAGLGAVVPIATFATMYDRLAEMGIGVPLWYGALLLVGISAASYFARRRGLIWTPAALGAGIVAVVGFAFISVSLVSMGPILRAPMP